MKNMYLILYFLHNDAFGCRSYYLTEEIALRAFSQMKSNGNYYRAYLYAPDGVLLDSFTKTK